MSQKLKIVMILGLLIFLIGIVFLLTKKKDRQGYMINTVMPIKSTIINSVTATGTIEPIEQVEIGTQVSGVIHRIFVDFNSLVKQGDLLAELDKSSLNARLLQSKASLASAQNELTWQTQNYNRVKILFEKGMVSETEYESAIYQLNNAKSQVNRLTSEVNQAEVDLSYATIYSPIDGIVLERAVEEGQTVAASLSTPTLFTIARDLTQMQVEADVDEADIGQVEHGQRVIFSVDAYPDTEFEGVITQIRLMPNITSNVVTYKVIIDSPNPDLKLKPGLTATITIITEEATDVLTIPVSAINFIPSQDFMLNTDTKIKMVKETPVRIPSNEAGFNARVWILKGDEISPMMIKTGITDRTHIEVSDGLLMTDSVIVSVTQNGNIKEPDRLSSPFMPNAPGRRRY